MSTHQQKLPPIDPMDLAGIDDLLTDDEGVAHPCAAVRQARRPLRRRLVRTRRGRRHPRAGQEFGSLGLLGMHLEGYGCAGMSATDYGLACTPWRAGSDSGVRSLVSVQGSLAMYGIWRWGSEEQKQEWLPRMSTGEAIGCFGLTEPDAGSDPGSMRTRARRDGDDWVLDGRKMWITNGSIADVAVVWAQAGQEHGGIRGFVVPTDTRASRRR